MSEEKKQEVLNEIKDALKDIPEKYHKEVAESLTHDIGVTARAIRIAESKAQETA